MIKLMLWEKKMMTSIYFILYRIFPLIFTKGTKTLGMLALSFFLKKRKDPSTSILESIQRLYMILPLAGSIRDKPLH